MPMTTELPVGDLFEFIGDFRLNGDGPPTTGRMGLARLQEILLSSTSPIGARFTGIEGRLTTAEGFTNQISGLNTRLLAVEALGGIAPGTDLAADGTAVRSTRYWARPGEAIRAWTIQTQVLPAAAVPLSVGGAISLDSTAEGGALLLLKGQVSAGPIALTKIEPGLVYTVLALVQRTSDDPVDAMNEVRPRLHAFSNTKANLNPIGIPSKMVRKADKVQPVSYTLSTVPGAADVLFPDPLGGYVRPYFAGQGTDGMLGIISIQQPTVASDFAGSIATGTRATRLASLDDLPARRAADGQSLKITYADLLKAIGEDMAGPPTYVWRAHTNVSAESKEIIPYDAGLAQFGVVNVAGAKAYVAQGGIPATLAGDGSVPVEALGGSWGTDLVEPGAVSAISESASKLTVYFRSTTNYNVALRAASQAYIDRIVGRGVTLTTDQANALRDFYGKLYQSGALTALGCFYNFRGPKEAAWLNLCDIPKGFADTTGTLPATSWRNVNFDGTTGWADTRLKFANIAGPLDHSILAYPGDATNQGSSRVAGGDGNVTLTPNRTATTVGARSLGSSLATPGGFTAGPGLVSVSRTDAEKVTFRQKKTVTVDATLAAASTAFSDRSILIGARNDGVTGGTPVPATGSYYLGPLLCYGAGHRMTASLHNAISDAMDEFVAATAVFS